MSEEEATVSFKQEIDHARKQWFRPFDNLAHVVSDDRKERKAKAEEERRRKSNEKKEKAKKKKLQAKAKVCEPPRTTSLDIFM